MLTTTVVTVTKIRRVKLDCQGYDKHDQYWGVDAPLFHFTHEEPFLTETGYFRCSDYQTARLRFKARGHKVER